MVTAQTRRRVLIGIARRRQRPGSGSARGFLMKFQAARVQDLADVTRMLGQASSEALASVRGIFAQWLPDGREDLESLIELGRLETAR